MEKHSYTEKYDSVISKDHLCTERSHWSCSLFMSICVGARRMKDPDGAIEKMNPSRARGIDEPSFIFESPMLHTLCLLHLVHVHFPIFIYFYFLVIFYSHQFEWSMLYTCAFVSSLHITEDPSGVGGSRHSQRPRSSCRTQGDRQPIICFMCILLFWIILHVYLAHIGVFHLMFESSVSYSVCTPKANLIICVSSLNTKSMQRSKWTQISTHVENSHEA